MYGQGDVQAVLPHDDARQRKEDGTEIEVIQIAFGNQEHAPHAGNGCQCTDE